MCGIIGILGSGDVSRSILEGLRRLEYRGYDSAGIATLVNGHIDRRRAEGKLDRLADRLANAPLPGDVGIGHTRWATHGAPTENNAHPHATDRVAIVHNGIIENFREIREELMSRGSNFASETDTEVVAHLITANLDDGMEPVSAAGDAFSRLEGAFALAVIFNGEHDLMIGARKGSPLVVGHGEGEMYLGSDALALSVLTRRVSYLEEGDWVVLRREGAEFRDVGGEVVARDSHVLNAAAGFIGKGNHRHYMLKEIHEQPTVIGDTLHSFVNRTERRISLPELSIDLNAVDRLNLVACGTSYYACLIARYWFEKLARIPVDVDIASEFRYREPPLDAGGVSLFVSQSGETMDTMEALRLVRRSGQSIISVVNVPHSTMARESDDVLVTHAGPEIGVASTKAFTTQLTTLLCLSVAMGRARGTLSGEREAELVRAVSEVPARLAEFLADDEALRALAIELSRARDVLYLGRGTNFPIAMEGALKLKEISYIHAEGYAAGEMKHGPIALIDEKVPVVIVAPSDGLFEKTVGNVQEVAARGGRVVLLSDDEGIARIGDMAWAAVRLPTVDAIVAPILYAVPVQLLAYHVAVVKGTDVDQPRNLAKSVTVE